MIFTEQELESMSISLLCKLWMQHGKAFEIIKDTDFTDYMMFGTAVSEKLYRKKYAEYEAYKNAMERIHQAEPSFGEAVAKKLYAIRDMSAVSFDKELERVTRVLDSMLEFMQHMAITDSLEDGHHAQDIIRECDLLFNRTMLS